MILHPDGDAVDLITQPDHAHLAGRIMERCVPLARHPRRERILRAVAEHDNGWDEADAAPAVDTGTGNIIDFVSAPLSVRHGVWPRGVGRLADDPWSAALVAQHAITVYDRYRSDRAWTSFFAEMERLRDAMLGRSGMPLDDLLRDYAFVPLGDLISLTFCTGWTDEQRYGEWRVLRSGARVIVTPDLFDGATIAFEIAAKRIQSRPFRDDDELRRALGEATPTTLRGDVAGTAGR